MKSIAVLLLLSLVFVSAVVSGVQGAEYEHCDECAKIVRDIDVVLHNNVSVDVIEFIIEEVCIKKNGFGECQGDAQCKAVCDGMISECTHTAQHAHYTNNPLASNGKALTQLLVCDRWRGSDWHFDKQSVGSALSVRSH